MKKENEVKQHRNWMTVSYVRKNLSYPHEGSLNQVFFSRFFANSCKCTFRFLEFFEKFCLSFSKILEFFEEMWVFRGKCEFFEGNAWVFYYFWVKLSDFLSFLLEFLRKIPWVWVFFPLSFFQND